MCIAILNKSAKLSKKSLQNCWDNNYHGAGIGYVDGNSIRSYHEGTSFESFYEEYQFIRNNTEHPLMLHFRIATHGKGTDMLHPHSVAEGKVSLIHNGIIYGLGNTIISDTRVFAELLGNFSPKNVSFIDHKGVNGFAMHLLGHSNKVVLMDYRGAFRILNSQLGHWDKNQDTWYSNDSYKRSLDYVYHGNTKVQKGGYQTPIWDSKTAFDLDPSHKSYNGYNRSSLPMVADTLEARDKHLKEVKAFEKNHMKALRSAMVDSPNELYTY
jgi:hypothetical protein